MTISFQLTKQTIDGHIKKDVRHYFLATIIPQSTQKNNNSNTSIPTCLTDIHDSKGNDFWHVICGINTVEWIAH